MTGPWLTEAKMERRGFEYVSEIEPRGPTVENEGK